MAEKVRIAKRSVDALEAREERYSVWDTEIAGFGVRVAPTGRKTYVLKYRTGGGRAGRVRWGIIGQHGTVTPDQARAVARRWAAEVVTGGDPAGERLEARAAPTVAELLDRYLDEHVTRHNKPSTVRSVRSLVESLVRPKLGHLKVEKVTVADVQKFHAALADRPYTANRAVAALSKAMALAEDWRMRPANSNPCARVRHYREKTRERFLSLEEFGRLGAVLVAAEAGPIEVPDDQGRPALHLVNREAIRAIRLLIFTGARRGEILDLKWRDVDLEAGRASLPDSKTGKKVVQLPAPAVQVLSEILAERGSATGYVIRGGDGSDPERPLVEIKRPWQLIRRAAGLEELRLHDLRHAYASIAVASGLSLPMIGALLGHREVRTTARYAHLADDPQKAAADLVSSTIAGAMGSRPGGGEVVPMARRPRR
jgi:integrase